MCQFKTCGCTFWTLILRHFIIEIFIEEEEMKYTFICYTKWSTCKKAKLWLEENNIEFDERPIKENNPTENETERVGR